MKKIIHVDMDCFFAAVEMRDFPELRGRPLAVGGARDRRGVISTCNYEARRFGVHSAMASAYAFKLCPDLILVPGRMAVYREVSAQIRSVFARYTDLIEPLSLDEAYLDVSHCRQHQGSATLMAAAIRREIFTLTGLTASAGIAPVKFLAKIASDLNKPNGQYVITPAMIPDFMQTLALIKIPGVGKVTAGKLEAMGLKTCADVQAYRRHRLVERFGKFGALLYDRAWGLDAREVAPHRERKSVGVETTLAKDIYSYEQCQAVMSPLIQELATRMRRSARARRIHKQVVKLKFDDFKQTTLARRSDEVSVQLFYDLLKQALERRAGRGIRLLGVAVGLDSDAPGSGGDATLHGAQLHLGF